MPPALKSRQQPPRVPELNLARTFSLNSPLIEPRRTDIRLFLTRCVSIENWAQYTDEEKKRIFKSLPDSVKSRLRKEFKNDMHIKQLCSETGNNDFIANGTVAGTQMASDRTSGHTPNRVFSESTSSMEKDDLDSTKPMPTRQIELDELLAKPPMTGEVILSDDYLKLQVARFRRDIADGYYQKSWQNQACKAQQECASGKLDEYLRLYAEELFLTEDDEEDGQESEDELRLATESSDGEFGKRQGTKRKRK